MNLRASPVSDLRVRGVDLDSHTRCLHYHGRTDVIAIKMKCCGTYYACIDCHAHLADHLAMTWPKSEWGENAILCGVCGSEMSIDEYLNSGSRCPCCGAEFNPGCGKHYHLYFDVAADSR